MSLKQNKIIGVASFFGPHVFGDITLSELNNTSVRVKANLKFSSKFKNKKLAWHIHEAGDLRGKGCKSACSHFNPDNMTHGGPRSSIKHVGDLGNLRVKPDGTSTSTLTADFIELRGPRSVIGRSFVVHESLDDLGKGGNAESLKTGNAGARIACAVIGYAQKSQLYF